MTNYSLLMSERIASFLEAYNMLPQPCEVPAELLIISAGQTEGKFSFRHVFTKGETVYFIFRKSGLTEGADIVWECADRELELVAREQQALRKAG